MNKDPAVSHKSTCETFLIRDGLTPSQMNYLRKYINRGSVNVEYSFSESRGRHNWDVDRVYLVSVDPAVGEVVLTAIRLLLSENLL